MGFNKGFILRFMPYKEQLIYQCILFNKKMSRYKHLYDDDNHQRIVFKCYS